MNDIIFNNLYMCLGATPRSSTQDLYKNASKIKVFNHVNKEIDFKYKSLCDISFNKDNLLTTNVDDKVKVISALLSFYDDILTQENIVKIAKNYKDFNAKKVKTLTHVNKQISK